MSPHNSCEEGSLALTLRRRRGEHEQRLHGPACAERGRTRCRRAASTDKRFASHRCRPDDDGNAEIHRGTIDRETRIFCSNHRFRGSIANYDNNG